MANPPALKRPKLDKDDYDSAYWPTPATNGTAAATSGGRLAAAEEEAAAIALVAHRQSEVERCKLKLVEYQNLLDEAEKKLDEAYARQARIQAKSAANAQASGPHNRTPPTPAPAAPRVAQQQTQPVERPQLVIPPVNTRPVPPPSQTRVSAAAARTEAVSTKRAMPAQPKVAEKPRQEANRPKRKIEQKEHQSLIPGIKSCSSPTLLRFHRGTSMCSQHKRKLRCLELCPVNDQLVVTSALDGLINLWQVESKGPSASLLSSTDCLSPKHRRWPEDIAWHPDGDRLFAVYTADGGDSQVSTMDLNVSGQKKVTFLQAKPHTKGIINSINFMPWADLRFVTAGSDHKVVLWQQREDSWNFKILHRDVHSSAVMGVTGFQQRKTILSVGADKRIIAFDPSTERTEFRNQIETKCMSVLPNPCDFNLYMVQTAAPEKQLRLYDIRSRQSEIYVFGWKQENSESQSALINQSWSPDGWYLSSGSADPKIHIFDIRYNRCHSPSQSVQAHQKRVFKAVWHQSKLLTSISSDLDIGLHKLM